MYPDQITGVLTTSIYVRKGCMCLAGAIEKLCILMNYNNKKSTKWLGIHPLEMSHLQQVKKATFEQSMHSQMLCFSSYFAAIE